MGTRPFQTKRSEAPDTHKVGDRCGRCRGSANQTVLAPAPLAFKGLPCPARGSADGPSPAPPGSGHARPCRCCAFAHLIEGWTLDDDRSGAWAPPVVGAEAPDSFNGSKPSGFRRFPLDQVDNLVEVKEEGIEPSTYGTKIRCSTTELLPGVDARLPIGTRRAI